MKKIIFVFLMVAILLAPSGGAAAFSLDAGANECDPGDPSFEVTGAPATVEMSADDLAKLVSDEEMANRGPSENLNSLGLNTQFALGDAGVYLTHDLADAEANDSAWLITPDTQYVLAYPGPAYGNLVEGGFLWVAARAATLSVGDYTVAAEGKPCHSWFVVLSGKDWDHEIDTDFNSSVEITDFDPGFAVVSRFAPGSSLSQKYSLDNAASAHSQKTCGSDGCSEVSFLILDVKTGAWVVISQSAPDAEWRMVATNVVILAG